MSGSPMPDRLTGNIFSLVPAITGRRASWRHARVTDLCPVLPPSHATDGVERAQTELGRAGETSEPDVQEQLRSIDEGLDEPRDGDAT